MAKLWCIMSRFTDWSMLAHEGRQTQNGGECRWWLSRHPTTQDIGCHAVICTCVRVCVCVPACVSACTRAMLTMAMLCVHSSNEGKQGHVAGRWTVWLLVAPGEGEGNLKSPNAPIGVLWNPWTQRHAVSATLTTALIKGLIIRFQLRSNLSSHIIALC